MIETKIEKIPLFLRRIKRWAGYKLKESGKKPLSVLDMKGVGPDDKDRVVDFDTITKAAIREIDLQDEIYYYLKDLKQKQEEQKVCLGAAYHQTRVAIDNGRNKAKTIEENPDLINLKENGDFLSTDSSKVLFRIARDSCGIHFKYHNLRHTHASWLAEHNIPAVVVKKRLGHTKEETTLRYYQHITQGMRDDLLGKLNGCSYPASNTKDNEKEKQMIIDIFSDEERVKDIIGRCKQTIDAVLSKSEFKHENWKYIAPTTSFENAVIEEVVKELKG